MSGRPLFVLRRKLAVARRCAAHRPARGGHRKRVRNTEGHRTREGNKRTDTCAYGVCGSELKGCGTGAEGGSAKTVRGAQSASVTGAAAKWKLHGAHTCTVALPVPHLYLVFFRLFPSSLRDVEEVFREQIAPPRRRCCPFPRTAAAQVTATRPFGHACCCTATARCG